MPGRIGGSDAGATGLFFLRRRLAIKTSEYRLYQSRTWQAVSSCDLILDTKQHKSVAVCHYRSDVHRVLSSTTARRLTMLLVGVFLLSSCAEDERRGIRLTPTSTVETGVRVLVDNCPGPTSLALSVREDVLWQIDAPSTPDIVGDEDADAVEDDSTVVSPPGIAEFLIGQAPDGWATVTPLESALAPGTRYTVRTQPDGQSIDFSTPDLAAGLLWDGIGNSRFNPDLVAAECSEPADVGAFAQNIVVLTLLGITASALVLVALILLLFVITRRFSRVRSLQKKAKQGGKPPRSQRPKVRAKN